MVLGFLLTAGVGTLISNMLQERQHAEEMARLEQAAGLDAAARLTQSASEFGIRWLLVVDMMENDRPLDELEKARSNAFDAYMGMRSALLTQRYALYRAFQDSVVAPGGHVMPSPVITTLVKRQDLLLQEAQAVVVNNLDRPLASKQDKRKNYENVQVALMRYLYCSVNELGFTNSLIYEDIPKSQKNKELQDNLASDDGRRCSSLPEKSP